MEQLVQLPGLHITISLVVNQVHAHFPLIGKSQHYMVLCPALLLESPQRKKTKKTYKKHCFNIEKSHPVKDDFFLNQLTFFKNLLLKNSIKIGKTLIKMMAIATNPKFC